MIQYSFALRGRNPDVLTCIANLSNDEVFTPPGFANRMLDTLAEAWAARNNSANIWADSSVKFLDPCTKSGVFLREITSRLNTTANFLIKPCIWYHHLVIPGLTRNPEDVENPGFPIEALGNDGKVSL